jgi:hypothetical protein
VQLVDYILDVLSDANEGELAWVVTTMSLTLPSPTVLGSTIATWAA